MPSPQGNGSHQGLLRAAGERQPASFRPSSSSTRTAASIRTSKTSRGVSRTANFIAFAPDGLTSVGGYPGDDEKGAAGVPAGERSEDDRRLRGRREVAEGASGLHRQDSASSASASAAGSAISWPSGCRTSARPRRSTAGRRAPRTPRRSRRRCCCTTRGTIRASTRAWPAYEAALKANNKTYTAYVYEDAQHGFHNDTTPRYDEAAAKLAWQRTLDFFNKNLRGQS